MSYFVHPDFESLVSTSLKERVSAANAYDDYVTKINLWRESRDPTALDETAFKQMLVCHDWYADYSDDGSVYRAAMKAERDFEELIKLRPEFAELYTTARRERASPAVELPRFVTFSALEKMVICQTGVESEHVPEPGRWLELMQFHRGMELLLNYRCKIGGVHSWFIDSPKARTHRFNTANGGTRPLLTVALPPAIERQLAVPDDVIVEYFNIISYNTVDTHTATYLHDRSLTFNTVRNTAQGTVFLNVVTYIGQAPLLTFVV